MKNKTQKFTEQEVKTIIDEKTQREQTINRMVKAVDRQQVKVDNIDIPDDASNEDKEKLRKKITNISKMMDKLVNYYEKAISRIPVKKKSFENIGRNDICPFCDSGKKYKKCCMDEINANIARDVRPGQRYKKQEKVY